MNIKTRLSMRKALGALAILTLVGTSVATSQPAAHAAAPTGYELSWSDEFDGTSLDTSKWGYAYGCFDTRLKTQTHYTDSPENVSVSSGYLHLTARHSPTREKWNKETRKMETIDRTCTRTENGQKVAYPAPFTSGMVQTRDDKGNVKYAAQGDFYAEARIQLPAGPSSWASFWFTGTTGGPWPGNGEIDAVEAKGYDPDYLQANTHTPRASDPSKSEQHQGQLGGDGTSQTQFHVYGVEKTGEKITFYLDGVPRHTVNYSDIGGANPFVVDGNGMVIRLNHMVGGSFLATNSGDTTYVDATPYADSYMGAGSDMLVDYVRVYSKKPAVEEPEAPVVPTPEPTAPVEPALPTDPRPADPIPADQTPAEPTPADPKPETPAPAEPTPADPTPAPVAPAPATPTPATPETPATPPTDDAVTPAPATPSPETPAPETPAPAPAPTEQPTPESPAPAVETPAPSATTPAPTVEPAAPANPTDGATPGTDGVHGAGPSTSTPGTNGAAIGGVLPAGTAPTVTAATTRGGDAALAKTGADTNLLLGALSTALAGIVFVAMRRHKARQ
nr:family 16 glycosylhydrolase [uncultured Actinomyces sp.]